MKAADLLTLAQWLSPAYPTGAFAWSSGLETAVAEGDVDGPATLAAWLETVLHHGAGRNDAILLACAWQAENGASLAQVAELAAALAPSAERRRETLEQGAAFARTTRAIWHLDLPDMAHPVAVGRAARLVGLPREAVVQLWLLAWASNLVQAAQRLMPLGQIGGQRLLRGLSAQIPALAAETADAGPDDLGSAAFLADAASMRHETREPRLFRS